MDYKLVFVLWIIIHMSSCSFFGKKESHGEILKNNETDEQHQILRERQVKSYNQYLSFFGDDLTNHFPKDYNANCEFEHEITNFEINKLSYRPPTNYFYRLIRTKQEVYEQSDTIFGTPLLKTSAFDTSNILIFSYIEGPRDFRDSIFITGMSFNESTKIGKANLNKNSKIPIPYFAYSYDNSPNTFTGLDSSFTIFVLDAKAGVFTDTTYLKINRFLPKKWKHGFSKGIATSEKKGEIIYWITVW